jgi:hypothetical protein
MENALEHERTSCHTQVDEVARLIIDLLTVKANHILPSTTAAATYSISVSLNIAAHCWRIERWMPTATIVGNSYVVTRFIARFAARYKVTGFVWLSFVLLTCHYFSFC